MVITQSEWNVLSLRCQSAAESKRGANQFILPLRAAISANSGAWGAQRNWLYQALGTRCRNSNVGLQHRQPGGRDCYFRT